MSVSQPNNSMKTKLVTLLLVGLNAGFLVGLAQDKPAPDEKVQKQDNQPATPPEKPATPPETAAPAEPVGEVLPLVQFEDAPMVDVVKTLARQANLNVIFDPKVTAVGPDGKSPYPPVSIRLENVTAQNVLEAVLNNNNLRLEKDPKTKISRVAVKDPAAADPLLTKIYQLKYTSPSNLVVIVTPTISPRSKAIPDVRTSQLIMVATEKELLELDPLIEKLDSATRQVLIEARIYETSRNPNSVKGINWEGTFGAQNFTFGNNSKFQEGLSPTKPTPGQVDPLTGFVVGGDPGYPGALSGVLQSPKLLANTANGFNPGTAFLNADGVAGVLSWFNKDAETEVISTPRTVTLDNQPTILNVTKAFPIFKVTTGGTQSGPTVDILYTNVGTILTVTPRISANSNVALRVVPEVSNIDSVDSQQEAGQTFTANIYAVRRIDTSVLIPSGNTLVMGGLMSDNITKSKTKVPFVGDIPGLGYLFRSSAKNRNKQNLIIFITPTIISDDDFQPTPTDFLKKHPLPDKAENDPGPFTNTILDSAEPHDWSKPVY